MRSRVRARGPQGHEVLNGKLEEASHLRVNLEEGRKWGLGLSCEQDWTRVTLQRWSFIDARWLCKNK